MKGVIFPVRPSQTHERFIRAANGILHDNGRVFRILDSRSGDVRRGDVFVPEGQEAGLSSVPGAFERDVSASVLTPLKCGRIALLWDESYFWGVLAVAGLERLGFEFDLITCADIRCGGLDEYDLLLVPGGWASEKSHRLEKEGREAVRRFVKAGNSYLGFCGGAGLSLSVADGLGLLPVKRKSAKKRILNFSGSLMVRPEPEVHPAWLGMKGLQRLYVWWPSQFEILDENAVRVLGRYMSPCEDFFVSDLNAADIDRTGDDWVDWEQRYGTNLNPERLVGEPAVIEGNFGDGRVVASYAHLETPGSSAGAVALFNLIQYLLPDTGEGGAGSRRAGHEPVSVSPASCRSIRTLAGKMAGRSEALRNLGIRAGLWEPRNDWFLLWPRGVKAFAFNSLFGAVEALHRCTGGNDLKLPCDVPEAEFLRMLDEAARLLERFFHEASGMLSDLRVRIPELSRGESENLYRRFSQMGNEDELYRQLRECLSELLYHLLRVPRM